MVQAPKCKVCGVAHWSNQPHHFTERAVETLFEIAHDAVSPDPARVVDAMKRASDLKPKPHAALATEAKPKRDRAAYMREWRLNHPKDKK